jgi:hypothetical protein
MYAPTGIIPLSECSRRRRNSFRERKEEEEGGGEAASTGHLSECWR